jgi:hypothetical protein
MVVERYTYERALEIQTKLEARGFTFVQQQQRRLDILKAAGLPRISGPRALLNGSVEMGNVYTFEEAATILRHPYLCWHEREAILKRGADRKAPWTMEARRSYWSACISALALGVQGTSEHQCMSGVASTSPSPWLAP